MIVAVFVIAAALLLSPLIAEFRRRPVTRAERDAAPGSVVKLSKGRTYFRWCGEGPGPVIVMVHGLTTPSPVYSALADRLAERGARVLTYDLYGRGLSDPAVGQQDAEFFTSQLNELLKAEAVEEDFWLVGYSMGGAIAAAYAQRHGARLKGVALIASAGLAHVVDPVVRFCRDAPFVGDVVMILFGGSQLRRDLDELRKQPADVPDIYDVIEEATYRRGYMAAVLSSMRNLLRGNQIKLHRQLAKSGLPMLALWGEKDDVIPIKAAETLSKANPGVKTVMIEDGDHRLPFTHSAKLSDEIARFVGLS